ncbi:MAG: tyrosine-type recombinase/integrase, partial [Methylobacter sp.]
GPRTQPITAELAAFLDTYIETLRPGTPWLFPSVEARSGHTIDVRKAFVRCVKRAGLDPKQVVRHTLRHTAITPLIREIAGPNVAVIDSAAAVARQLQRRLEVAGLLADAAKVGTECFWTSGALDKAKPLVAQLWKPDVETYALPAN